MEGEGEMWKRKGPPGKGQEEEEVGGEKRDELCGWGRRRQWVETGKKLRRNIMRRNDIIVLRNGGKE